MSTPFKLSVAGLNLTYGEEVREPEAIRNLFAAVLNRALLDWIYKDKELKGISRSEREARKRELFRYFFVEEKFVGSLNFVLDLLFGEAADGVKKRLRTLLMKDVEELAKEDFRVLNSWAAHRKSSFRRYAFGDNSQHG